MHQPVILYDDRGGSRVFYRDIFVVSSHLKYNSIEDFPNVEEIKHDFDVIDAICDDYLLDYFMNSPFKLCVSHNIVWRDLAIRYNRGFRIGDCMYVKGPNEDKLMIKYDEYKHEFMYGDKTIIHEHGDRSDGFWFFDYECNMCDVKLKDAFCQKTKSARQGKYK